MKNANMNGRLSAKNTANASRTSMQKVRKEERDSSFSMTQAGGRRGDFNLHSHRLPFL